MKEAASVSIVMPIIVGLIGLVLTALGTVLITQFKDAAENLKKIQKSVNDLNIKIAEVIRDQTWQKKDTIRVQSDVEEMQAEIKSFKEEFAVFKDRVTSMVNN